MQVTAIGSAQTFRGRLPAKTFLTMRLIILLTIVASLQSSAAGWSQYVSINLKNSPVEKVFLEMRRQTGYQFIYNIQLIHQARKVTINVKNVPFEQALKLSLNGQPFTYT